MIIWTFYRIVETLIIYLVCSLFTNPPDTLGVTLVIEGVFIIYSVYKYFLAEED